MQIASESAASNLFSYIVAAGLQPGRVYTYAELSRALGKPLQQRRAPIYQAVRMLEREHRRTLVCVIGSGYRVAHPDETCDVAALRMKRSGTQARRGAHTVRHSEVAAMSPEKRFELDQLRASLQAVEREVRQVKRRVVAVQDRAEVQGTTIEALMARVAALERAD